MSGNSIRSSLEIDGIHLTFLHRILASKENPLKISACLQHDSRTWHLHTHPRVTVQTSNVRSVFERNGRAVVRPGWYGNVLERVWPSDCVANPVVDARVASPRRKRAVVGHGRHVDVVLLPVKDCVATPVQNARTAGDDEGDCCTLFLRHTKTTQSVIQCV